MDSFRVNTIRQGWPVTIAANPIKGCTERASFAPKPPPAAVGTIRTLSLGRPRIVAVSSRSITGACVQAWITTVSPSIQATPASGSI